jgi:putative transposase
VILHQLLEVSRSGFYAWKHRQKHPSERMIRDRKHLAILKALHEESRKLYGSPRLGRRARQHGLSLGRHATARVMRLGGPVGQAHPMSKGREDAKAARWAVYPELLIETRIKQS